MMLATVHIIMGEAVGCCSHYLGSSSWLMFPLFWIRLVVAVSIILDQAIG
jgi:hypothetical protein